MSSSSHEPATATKREINWARLSTKVYPYLLIAPTVIILFTVLVWPMIASLIYSFQSYNILRPDLGRQFIGFDNYIALLSSSQFWMSLRVTFIYTAAAVSLELVLGLGLALLLNRTHVVGLRMIRTLMLIPFLSTPVVVALAWKFMLHAEYGMLNYFASVVGIPSRVWLGPGYALPSLIGVEVWQHTSFVLLILLAGLQSLPSDPYEAAVIDGASTWQLFTNITLPLLRPVILVALVFRTMFTLRVFDTIWVLTGGGPADATRTLSIGIYLTGFRQFDVGEGAALSWILLLVTMAISMVYWRYLSGEVEL